LRVTEQTFPGVRVWTTGTAEAELGHVQHALVSPLQSAGLVME